MSYQYIGEQGDFCLKNPEKTSCLYFPLANEQGIKSCVTPDLGGDLKTGQNSFFMPPVSNMEQIAELLGEFEKMGADSVSLMEELEILLSPEKEGCGITILCRGRGRF